MRIAIDVMFLYATVNMVEPVNVGFELIKLARCNNKVEKSSHGNWTATGTPLILIQEHGNLSQLAQLSSSNGMHLEHIVHNEGE